MSDGTTRECCGLFGIFGCEDAAGKTFRALFALQHRGEEGCGIASTDGRRIVSHRGMGLVNDVFTPDALQELRNRTAIGHVRYSTMGSSTVHNVQPLVVDYLKGQVAVAHNGNITNAPEIRRELEERGSIFQTTMDTEVILHLLASPSHGRREDDVAHALRGLEGAFSLLFLMPDMMIAARDRHGFRPLCLGRLGGSPVVASETCAFLQIGAEYVREIEPGEAVFFRDSGVESRRFVSEAEVRPSHCIFEHIYFARPDSLVCGQNVHEVRKALGRQLACEHPVEADVVVPIPDGGTSAAIGYAEESGIPLDFGIIRNHYVGRTFIQASQRDRSAGVAVKLSPVREVLQGRRVVLIEDSIVRGTTSRGKIAQFREARPKELHMRITCPPHQFPCYYGIDFQLRHELIAATRTVDEIRDFLRLDSLGYLSPEGMLDCMAPPPDRYCVACFTGCYPVAVEKGVDKVALEGGRHRARV